MIPYFGKHFLKRYMPKKPIVHGMKAYIAAEAHSTYVISWFINPMGS